MASFVIARRSAIELVRDTLRAGREHPPFYYLLLHFWMRGCGTSEFALRTLSAITMVATVALTERLARRLLSPDGALAAGLLMGTLPLALWAARTARMYSLVLLLAVAITAQWLALLRRPDRCGWMRLLLLSLIGVMTHYALIIFWAVEAGVLLLFPRRTRALRRGWATIALTAGGILVLWLRFAPGAATTVSEMAGRFPGDLFRGQATIYLLMDFLIQWHYPTLMPLLGLALLMTAAGWFVLWRWGDRVAATVLLLWGMGPILLTHLMPEALQARYIIAALPAFALGMAALLDEVKVLLPRLLLALGFALAITTHWSHVLTPPDRSASTAFALIRKVSRPGDLLLFNGPWPRLLTHYYPVPEELPMEGVPTSAPPGFDAEVDLPRLEQFAKRYQRLWVYYGATRECDPTFAVSRWLAEESYESLQQPPLYLYLPAARVEAEPMITQTVEVAFGDWRLREIAIGKEEPHRGEIVPIRMRWEGEALSWEHQLTLSLIGPDGAVWLDKSFTLGPVLYDASTMALPSSWTERRGLLIPIGLPPGIYTLTLHVEGFPPPAGSLNGGRFPLATLTVGTESAPTHSTTAPYRLYLPLVMRRSYPGAHTAVDGGLFGLPLPPPNPLELEEAGFGALQLVGAEAPPQAAESYPLEVQLWWRATAPLTRPLTVALRLEGPQRTPWVRYPLGPSFYPPSMWKPGETIRQQFTYSLPRELRAGTYLLNVHVETEQGERLTAHGERHARLSAEYLRYGVRRPVARDRIGAAAVRVISIPRRFHPPLLRHYADVRFDERFRLRGYRITATTVHAGETITLTEFWQALTEPPQVYAVFNHLWGADGKLIWQADSWPRAGVYTTDHWVAGEVVDERYTIILSPETPPGTYTLTVGLYDPLSEARLPAIGKDGERYKDDAVPLLTLEVVP